MKVVFVSNYFNHHQRYLSDNLYSLTDGQYHFVETSAMREERRKLGYGGWVLPEYVVNAYSTEGGRKRATEVIKEADVVIAGSADEQLISDYICSGGLLFRYSERLIRRKISYLKYPLNYIKLHRQNPGNANIYLLSAGKSSARDFAVYGLFKHRMFKWGYFPECREYEDIAAAVASKDPKRILWCGRLLDCKHPDDAVSVAGRLKKNGYSFTLDIIGCGPMEERLNTMIRSEGLEDCVHMLGSMPPEEVREHMESAGIFLFTSDRRDGWGAVVNEAMNSGCCVVASDLAGSVSYLIKNNENGILYSFGNSNQLYGSTAALLDDRSRQADMGIAAYNTIKTEWNPQLAAERIICLADALLNGNNQFVQYVSGPCSPEDGRR